MFYLQVLVVLLLASNLAVGGCLDRYPVLTTCPIISILISRVILNYIVLIFFSNAYYYCFLNSSSSSHHLAGVFLVLVQQIQEGQLLVEGFSVVWEVNQVKELQIKTHLAPLLLPEGSGSNQVGLCKRQNKILACRSCYFKYTRWAQITLMRFSPFSCKQFVWE